ncbi:hypothetical protein MLD52_04465 [Puniceicoccaceae bacterium K14]|nr:hypothetical protein [Puniceicoccaceae bacterium K14]
MIDHSINQVVPRILEALEREVGGFAAARDAWAYSLAVERLNGELEKCQKFLEEGDLLSVIVLSEAIPSLHKRIADLDFEKRLDWDSCCEQFNWEKANPLSVSKMEEIEKAVSEIADLPEWLLKQVRLLDLDLSLDSRKAFALYSKLLKANSSDTALLSDYQKANKAALKNLEQDLLLVDTREETESVLDAYRSVGIDIPRKEGLIEDALELENAALVKDAGVAVDRLISNFSKDLDFEGLLEREKDFLITYYEIHTKIGALSQEKQTAFRSIEDRLIHAREYFEVNAQIGEALRLDSKKDAKRQIRLLLGYANANEVEIEDSHAVLIKERKLAGGVSVASAKNLVGLVGAGIAAAVAILLYTSTNDEPDVGEATLAEVVDEHIVFEPIIEELIDIVDRGFSLVREERVSELVDDANGLAENQNKTLLVASPAVVYYKNEFELLRQERARELQIIADYWIDQSSRAVADIEAIESEDELAIAVEKSRDVLEKASEALAAANELDGEILEDVIYAPASKVFEAQDRLDALEYARAEMLASKNFVEFFEPLERIYQYEEISESERAEIENALQLKKIDDSELFPELIAEAEITSFPNVEEGALFFATTAKLDSEERYLLEGLVSDIWVGEVHIAEAQYFRGTQTPLNSNLVYTAESIRGKTQSSEYAEIRRFRLREFDRNGRPNSRESSYALVDKGVHGKFGISFSESKLSKESVFYNNVLEPKVHGLLAGGARELMLEMTAAVIEANELNANLRTYWLAQINVIVSKNPNKWGLPYSPEIRDILTKLGKLKTAQLDPNNWLIAGYDDKPSIEFGDIKMIAEKAKVRARFAEELNEGTLVPLGYVKTGGALELREGVSDEETLWSVDPDSGKLSIIDDLAAPIAYSPIIGYRNTGRSAYDLYHQKENSERAGLSLEDYKAILPPLFK